MGKCRDCRSETSEFFEGSIVSGTVNRRRKGHFLCCACQQKIEEFNRQSRAKVDADFAAQLRAAGYLDLAEQVEKNIG